MPACFPLKQAREFYDSFVDMVRQEYEPERVHDGVFGAMMGVASVNDGPVTFIIDSEADFSSNASMSASMSEEGS
eukprot:364584-Chlamydomonas_euryale.AAC.1